MNKRLENLLRGIFDRIDKAINGEQTYDMLELKINIYENVLEDRKNVIERLTKEISVLDEQLTDELEEAENKIRKLEREAKLPHLEKIESIVDNIMTTSNAEQIYNILNFDSEGYALFRNGCKNLGERDFYGSFGEEDAKGVFEDMSGFAMLEYAETEKFGSFKYEIQGMYEFITEMHLDKTQESYIAYRENLFYDTVKDAFKHQSPFSYMSSAKLANTIENLTEFKNRTSESYEECDLHEMYAEEHYGENQPELEDEEEYEIGD